MSDDQGRLSEVRTTHLKELGADLREERTLGSWGVCACMTLIAYIETRQLCQLFSEFFGNRPLHSAALLREGGILISVLY